MASVARELEAIRAAMKRAGLERQTCRVEEAAARLGVSRAKFRAMLKAGVLRSSRLGRARVVPLAEIERVRGL